jgi:cyclohexanecarboxylate-CoA ligase
MKVVDELRQRIGPTEQAISQHRGPTTLKDWISDRALRTPSATALIRGDEKLDYAELHQRAERVAALLVSLGVRKGDVVAAQLPNCVEFVVAYLAVGYAGAIFQTVHMPYRLAEIGLLLDHSGAKVFICLDHFKDFSPANCGLSLVGPRSSLKHVIVVGNEAPPGAIAFSEAFGHERSLTDISIHPGDLFQLLYTSGTTSAPKGVPISYDRFLPNASKSAEELGVTCGSVVLSAAPFTHLYGLFSLNVAFAAGAAIALLPVFAPHLLVNAINTFRPTAMFVAPAHIAACLQEGLLSTDDLSCLEFVLISGSACPQTVARNLQALMNRGDVLQLWGMSELQAGSFTRPGDPDHVRFGTAGRASPGTGLRITNESGVVKAGIEGDLEVRGPSVFSGYLNNEVATTASFTNDGWFRTGDLARLDVDGNLTITGRSKDVINRGGVKFNPSDIEQLIAQHPNVSSCAIVPMPDAVLGERACCFVVQGSGDRDLQLADICEWLAAQGVAKLKWPERIELISEMPMTPTKKIMKGELTQKARMLD